MRTRQKQCVVTEEVAMDDTQESKVGLSVCLHCRPCASVYNCGVMTPVKQKHRLQNTNFEPAVVWTPIISQNTRFPCNKFSAKMTIVLRHHFDLYQSLNRLLI